MEGSIWLSAIGVEGGKVTSHLRMSVLLIGVIVKVGARPFCG